MIGVDIGGGERREANPIITSRADRIKQTGYVESESVIRWTEEGKRGNTDERTEGQKCQKVTFVSGFTLQYAIENE